MHNCLEHFGGQKYFRFFVEYFCGRTLFRLERSQTVTHGGSDGNVNKLRSESLVVRKIGEQQLKEGRNRGRASMAVFCGL